MRMSNPFVTGVPFFSFEFSLPRTTTARGAGVAF
jgi:hypothetical protein